MFRNTVLVDLEEYVKLRNRVDHLERERKEMLSVVDNYNEEPRLCLNVSMFEQTINGLLEESKYAGKYELETDLREWSRSLDVFSKIRPVEEEEDEEVE